MISYYFGFDTLVLAHNVYNNLWHAAAALSYNVPLSAHIDSSSTLFSGFLSTMKNYVNPKYCIAFANGSCSLGEACSFRHDVLKCSCERIFSSSAHEKHMETATHSKNLAALRAQLENGDNSTLQTIIGYRLEYTLSGGGKCKCRSFHSSSDYCYRS